MRKVLLAAAALAGAGLVALSASAAGAPDRAPRANGVGAPIAWGDCDPPGAGSAVRHDPRAARLGSPQRAHDPPRADPPPRQQARAADRHAVHEPGRTGRHRRRSGEGRSRRVRRRSAAAASTSSAGIPRGTNASTRVRCFRNQRSEASFWAGASIPTHQRRLGALCAQDRRPGAALRRGQRLASAPHLNRRHRPRPRPPARPDGRGEADLPRPLLRHLHRPDLRQHVPRPGPGDAARWASSTRPKTRRGPRRGAASDVRLGRRGLRPVPLALRPARDRSAARSPAAATPRPSGSSGCSRG